MYYSIFDVLVPIRFVRKKINKESIMDKSKELIPQGVEVKDLLIDFRLTDHSFKESNRYKDDIYLDISVESLEDSINVNKSEYIAGLEAAGLYGQDLFEKFMTIDDAFYEMMERLTNQSFDNIVDLASKVETYKHTFLEGLSEKTLDKLAGHLGEVQLANYLEQHGLDVIWPDASNNPGWDLIINGHEINSKFLENASNLTNHFSEYSDIPAFIPGDSINIPEDAIYFNPANIDNFLETLNNGGENLTFVFEDLSHGENLDQVQDASDVLLGNHDAFDLNFPYITFAISTFRELDILFKKETDIFNSAKNIGLDVAGTGVGALTGGKIGAGIGGIFGPIGLGVGAIVGSIAGAMGGRKLTNNIKMSPFKDSIEDYKKSKNRLIKIADTKGHYLETKFKELRNVEEAKLEELSSMQKNEIKSMVEYIKDEREKYLTIDINEIKEISSQIEEQVDEIINDLNIRLKQQSWILRIFNPDVDSLATQYILTELRKIKKDLHRYFKSISKYKTIRRNDVYQYLGLKGLYVNEIKKFYNKYEMERKLREVELTEKINESQRELLENRKSSFDTLQKEVELLKKEYEESLKPYVDKVKEDSNIMVKEAKKLGIKM